MNSTDPFQCHHAISTWFLLPYLQYVLLCSVLIFLTSTCHFLYASYWIHYEWDTKACILQRSLNMDRIIEMGFRLRSKIWCLSQWDPYTHCFRSQFWCHSISGPVIIKLPSLLAGKALVSSRARVMAKVIQTHPRMKNIVLWKIKIYSMNNFKVNLILLASPWFERWCCTICHSFLSLIFFFLQNWGLDCKTQNLFPHQLSKKNIERQ